MYSKAGEGLDKMFIAELGSIICTFIAIVPLIGTVIGAIGVFVFAIISVWGLYVASSEIEGCKIALYLTVANMIVSVLLKFKILATLMTLAGDVLSFLITFFVCTSVASALRNKGDHETAAKGDLVWKINLICSVVSIILSIVSKLPIISILSAVVGFLMGIVALIAMILYLIFLYQSSRSLS